MQLPFMKIIINVSACPAVMSLSVKSEVTPNLNFEISSH